MAIQVNDTVDTEALIKVAAKKVFLQKGLAGTRLQEIADEAGIGRTALHYYFRSKEKLFQEVWKEVFSNSSQRILSLRNSNLSIVEKMQEFASCYFDKALETPENDLFLLNEFNQNPEVMVEIFSTVGLDGCRYFLITDIEKAIEKGELKGDAQQIFITLVSICIFPFAAMAMLKTMMHLSEEAYMKMMAERKAYVLQFLETTYKG